jgi:hypothetical protein
VSLIVAAAGSVVLRLVPINATRNVFTPGVKLPDAALVVPIAVARLVGVPIAMI